MSEPLIPINIIIADRSYRLKITKQDEEMVRKTIKLINDKIIEYKSQFAGKDMQDYVSMVLLWLATEQQNPSAATNILAEQQRLQLLEDLLDRSLSTQ